MATLAELVLKINANTTQLVAALEDSQKRIDRFGRKTKALGKNMALMGGAGAAAFGLMAKGSADFESGMAEVNTLVGLSEGQLDSLSRGVRDLSTEFGLNAVDATKALYQAISAGQEPAKVLGFLEVAARASVGGVTDLTTSVDGLTNILNAFKLGTEDAERVSDIMFRTVALGKTTMDELSSSFFQASPIAKATGVSVEELAAAVATVTLAGTPTKVAMTGLRQAMVSLQKPTVDMKGALDKMGFSSGTAAIEALGLVGTLDAVRQATEGDAEAFAKAIGSVEALTPVLQLTGGNLSVFEDILKDVSNSAGSTGKAFDIMAETTAHQFAIMRAKISDVSMTIGDALLPVLQDLLKQVIPVIEKFAAWAKDNQGLIKIIAIATAGVAALGATLFTVGLVLGPLVKTFTLATKGIGLFLKGIKLLTLAHIRQGVVAAAAWAATFAPITLGIVAIGAVISAFFLFKDKMISIFNTVGRIFGEFVDFYLSGFRLIIWALNKFGLNIPQIMDFGNAWSNLGNVMGEGLDSAKDAIDGLIGRVADFDGGLASVGRAIEEFAGKLPLIAAGLGRVKDHTIDLGGAVIEATRNMNDFRQSMFEVRRQVQEFQVGARLAYSDVAGALGVATENVHSMISALEIQIRQAQGVQVGAMLIAASISEVGREAEIARQKALNFLSVFNGLDMAKQAAVIDQKFIEALASVGKEHLAGVSAFDVIKAGGVGNIGSFASGGIVPGPIGQAQLAVVHGGETITPAGRTGGGMTVNITVNGSVTSRDFRREVLEAVRDGARAGSLDRVFQGT